MYCCCGDVVVSSWDCQAVCRRHNVKIGTCGRGVEVGVEDVDGGCRGSVEDVEVEECGGQKGALGDSVGDK